MALHSRSTAHRMNKHITFQLSQRPFQPSQRRSDHHLQILLVSILVSGGNARMNVYESSHVTERLSLRMFATRHPILSRSATRLPMFAAIARMNHVSHRPRHMTTLPIQLPHQYARPLHQIILDLMALTMMSHPRYAHLHLFYPLFIAPYQYHQTASYHMRRI